ncbi:CPBP family intramembrane glutamic endopeptidase [Zhaonella formicivorans]|uniref:CPBP family intramembrane glutamic endopeptidase n=1 Tax=Zhaonella formicivorans TaxID=2528593 RepID=UPI0010E6AFFC|nr:CPBP family intramembrane glutamic endopeptidase [Zhaonella formicivorans]
MALKRRWPGPPWGLVDAMLALVLVFIINNSMGFIAKALGIRWSTLGFFTFASVLQTAGIIGVVFYYALVRYHTGGRALGLSARDLGRYIFTGLAGGVLIFLVVMLSGIFVQRFYPVTAELQPFAQLVLNANTWPQLAVLFVLGVVLAPLGEELYFRGFLYPVLRSYLGVPAAVLLSGGFFGLLHFDLLRFLPLALGGAGLAWLYERTGSLYTSIAAHGLWNFVMLALLAAKNPNFI